MNGQEIKKGERNARLTEVSQSVIKRIYCQTFNKHRYRIIIYRFSFCGNWDRKTIIRKAEDKKNHSLINIHTHRLTRKRRSTRKRKKSNPSPVNNLHVVEKCVTNDHHICLCASNAFHKWLVFIEKKKRWQQAIGRSIRNSTKYVIVTFLHNLLLVFFRYLFVTPQQNWSK